MGRPINVSEYHINICSIPAATGIHFDHLSWSGDALTVQFYVTKTLKDGTAEKDIKHVYANPFKPAICPILALGIFLMSQPRGNDSPSDLFPANSSDTSRWVYPSTTRWVYPSI